MSFTIKGKIYSIAKEYLFISITVLFLGVAGVLLPYLYGGIDNAKATTFSTPTLMSESAPGDSNLVKLKKINDVYYLTYKPSGEPLKISTSSDMSSWSAFSTVINGVGMSYDFGYYTNGGYYYLVFSDGFNASIIFATSSDAVTWSATSTIIADIDTDGYPIYLSAPAADNFLSLGYAFYDGVEITAFLFATSSDGVTWATSTVASNVLGPLGFVSDGSNLHALYDVFTDTNFNTSTEVYLEYAKSTDGGATWATTTIGRTDYQFYFPDNMSTLELDNDGNPGIVYYKVDEISDFVWADEGDGFQWTGDGNVTTSLIYAKYSGSAWASSTIATFPLAIASTSFGLDIRPSLTFAENNEALFAGPANNFYPYLVTNTNTLDISQVTITQIDDKAVDGISGGGSAGLSLVFDTSTLSVGFAFVGADPVTPTDRDLFFTTSTVVVAPSAPTGLTATPSTTTQIDLTWNSVGGATSYILYSATTSEFTVTNTVTTTVLTSFSNTSLTASTQYYYKIASINEIGTGVVSASVNTTTLAEVVWDGSLSSIDYAGTNSYTRLIYANNQYYYYFTGYENGEYHVELTTSTSGVDGTWSSSEYVIDEAIRSSIDAGLVWPIYDIQYNSSTDYFGLTAYVSSTDTMVFVTSSDGVTWGSQQDIYTYTAGDGEEWIVNMDFLEGTDLIAIGYEFDKIAFSTDAGATWSTTTMSAMNPDTDDFLGVGISAGPVLHAGYGSDGVFYYASSTDSGSTWTTTTVHTTTNGSNASLNRFVMDGNNRPSLLLSDTQQGSVNAATSTMLFASRNDNGTWSTSTIGTNIYSFTDDVALSDMGFYGAKPYVVYYGTSNYADFAYSTSTASPFTFVLNQNIDSSNAVGEMSRISTTYDSANTTAAVAYVNDSGELRFVTSSVDLVGAVEGTTPTAPSGLSSVVATSSIAISWTDNSDDEDGFVIQGSNNGVDYTTFSTVSANTTSTVLSSLLPNTHYWAKVAAYNSFGTSTYTASNDDYTNPVAPGTPTVSNVSTSSLTLSWDDNLNGSNTEYYILYSDANFSTTTATTTSIIGLTPNTEYTFTVRAQYLSSSTLYTAYSASSTATTTVAVNSTPTLTAISPVFATDGTGLVTVTTTVSDGDGDTVTLYVDYSLDGGSTWTSSTLGTVTGDGTPATTTGGITGITSTIDGNDLTFTWDTQTDGVTVTTTAQIRITPNDSTENGSAQTSSNFTVDNAAPSAPTISTLTPSGPMITLGWDAVAGASTYTVSTTAGSATTTSGTSVTYMNLLTDVSYDFQVLATDAYSNSSDYSTVTSTYTTAYAPGQPTMSVSDTYNLIINENNNPSTVEYSICLTLDGLTCASASHYAQANGAIGGTVVWQSYEDWGGASGVSLTGGTYNVAYQFLTQARNSAGVTTTFSTASESTYSPANQASAPTIGTPTTSTLPITINVNSNPVATTYAVYNSTDGNYLDADGASTSTAVYSTTSTLGSSFAATGLSPNTAYEFTVIARNGDGVNATTSTASTETYTNPTVPTTVVGTANGQTSQIVTWSANSNGTGTVYELFNVTASSAIVTTTQTSFTVTGLTADTSYQYKVRAEYLGDFGTYTSYSSNSTAVSTDAVSTEVEMTLSTGASSTFQLTGQDSHTVTLDSISSGVATLSFASTPFSVSLSAGQSSNNTANSITITMNSVGASSASFSVSTYTPPSSSPSSGGGSPVVSNPPVVVGNHGLLINNGDDNTGTINVTLNISASNVTQVSISNSSDFTNASFVAYSNNYNWVLNPGNGLKTVYVKLRSSDGSTITISDTITLTSQATDQVDGNVCTLTPEQAYKSLSSVAVYYITPECTKRAFTNSYIYFTYFPTWSSVKITDKLSSIPNDTLGFMPYGPLYDPQYGALVKTVKDPKVYLLLNTEKYWITSESIFNSLNYHWNWIEDVDQRLLNKYTIGSEINYTDHHPNYTLVKYKNNNKVYRLEPGSAEATPGKPELYGQQVKRWITDEKTFNSLNFRWDRIVTINDAEVYEDGENLGTEVESVETTKYTFTSLLALGSTGEEVKRLQIRLQELGYLDKSIIPTTNFGPSTQQAVIKLQTEHNLTPALGYTGPGTRGVLNGK